MYVVVLGRLECLGYLGCTLEFPLDLIIHVLHRGSSQQSYLGQATIIFLCKFCE